MQAQRRAPGMLANCAVRARVLAAVAAVLAVISGSSVSSTGTSGGVTNGAGGTSAGHTPRGPSSTAPLRRLPAGSGSASCPSSLAQPLPTSAMAVASALAAACRSPGRAAASLAFVAQQILLVLLAITAAVASATSGAATATMVLSRWEEVFGSLAEEDELRCYGKEGKLLRPLPTSRKTLALGDKQASTSPRPRIPVGSMLAASLQNGNLAATFSRVEAMHGVVGRTGTWHFRALHRLEGAWYALKLVAMTNLKAEDDIAMRQELREVRSLGALADSRNVVRYVTAWCEESCFLTAGGELLIRPAAVSGDPNYTVMLLVQTELCHGVTLRSWLDERTLSAPPAASALELHFAEQLIKAGREIHRSGLVHGGLSSESLFVRDDAVLKVGDFSSARPAEEGDSGRAEKAADVLAAALVCLELLSLAARCSSRPAAETGEQVPAALAEALPGHALLLDRMLSADVHERPSFAEAYSEMKRLRTETLQGVNCEVVPATEPIRDVGVDA